MIQLPEDIEYTVETFNAKFKKKRYVIYWIILFSVIATIISLPFIHIDITSKSRGIVRSIYNNATISPIVNGKITYVNIFNNKNVKIGDTLLVIDTIGIQTQLNSKEKIYYDLENQISDLLLLIDTLSNKNSFKTAIYKQEWHDYTEKREEFNIKIQQLERDFFKSQNGFNSGLISKTEHDQNKDKLTLARINERTFSEQQLTAWHNSLKDLDEQRICCISEIEQLKIEKINNIILSPINGTINTSNYLQKESFVYSGQNIATISPNDSLIIECYVSPCDIGFIHLGQLVKLQYDAFNYNQWGVGEGIVYDIDNNITIQDSQSYFIVRCKISDLKLKLKNGYEVSIKKGQTLTGQFLTTRRNLWQLLFDKIDDWLNPNQKFNNI